MALLAVDTAKGTVLDRVERTPASLATGLVRAARPLQWAKNVLVFAGIIFSANFDDLHRWSEALIIFVAFCAASSAAYLANDVRDVEHDRAHPLKRSRPVAAGDLSPRAALAAAAVLALLALGLASLDGLGSLGLAAAFIVLQAAYTTGLKDMVLVDVVVIAWLFVIRAAAGAVAVEVRISPWLILCTGLLALFLALAKRRGELLLVGGDASPGRPVLAGYSLQFVDQLLAVVTVATISAYSLYTFTATESDVMMLTIPLVVFGLFRYLYLVHRRDLGEEPDRVLVTDAPILLAVLLWASAAVLILLLA